MKAVALDEPGPLAKLLSDEAYRVTFMHANGDTFTVPSHEFYMSHRGATPAEMDGEAAAPRFRPAGGRRAAEPPAEEGDGKEAERRGAGKAS